MGRKDSIKDRRAFSAIMTTLLMTIIIIAIVIAASLWSGVLASIFIRYDKVEIKNAYVVSRDGKNIVTFQYTNVGSTGTSINSVQLNGEPLSSYTPVPTLGGDLTILPSPCETGVSKSSTITFVEGAFDQSGNRLTAGVTLSITLLTTSGNNYPVSVVVQGTSYLSTTMQENSSSIPNTTFNQVTQSDNLVTDNDIGDPWFYIPNQLLQLYVEGSIIRDSVGPLFLVGCNSRGTTRNPREGWDDFWTLAEFDAKTIKGYGFNVVRLAATYWAKLEIGQNPKEFVYDIQYLDRMKVAVKAFNDQGLYVILNMHTYESFHKDTLGKIIPIAYDGSFDDAFYTDKSNTSGREHLKRLWLLLSDTFKNWPGVAGYDILNEPHNPIQGLTPQEVADYWWDMVDYITAGIRANGDNHIIFANFAPYSQNANFMSRKLNDTNIVYEPHWYRGLGGADFEIVENNDLAWLRNTFGLGDTEISTKMSEFNVPFIIGELSCTYFELPPEKEVWLRNSLTVFKESTTIQGWTYWTYWNDGRDVWGSGWQNILMEYAADKSTQVRFSVKS